jgi:hypothetical protein
MRYLPPLLVLIFAGCVRSPSPLPPLQEDRSIVFPHFFDQEAIEVGAKGIPYEIDGTLLRAISVAASDFIPPGTRNLPCRDRQEAQFYRVLRQGDVIFVHIYENLEHCGHSYPALDSDAQYAVSTDGRILRRLIGSQVELPLGFEDGGTRSVPSRPGVSPTLDSIWNAPAPSSQPMSPDAGSGPPVPVPAPTPETDGGQ